VVAGFGVYDEFVRVQGLYDELVRVQGVGGSRVWCV